MSKILITGADGFTGRYLAAELRAAGHDVHGTVHRDDPARGQAHGHLDAAHLCDLRDHEEVAHVVRQIEPERVVHLAAIAFVAHGDVDAMYRTNIVGSRNLLAALAACPRQPQAVLLASSANIYGNATEGVIDEGVAPAPANDYAVSKLAMEHMAALWTGKLPITIVRPFNYTGIGQSENFLLPKIVSHYKRRAPVIELGNLHVERDFSDVRTVVECYRRLLDPALAGHCINVCSGTGHSLRQVLDIAAEITGHHPEVRVNPAFVRDNEVHKLVGSNRALDTLIGPVHRPPLRETLAWMLA